MPVRQVHAPCLLISQRVWGANPIPKLERSVRAAEQLGAQTVVVHPPFRWQRRYAEGFRSRSRNWKPTATSWWQWRTCSRSGRTDLRTRVRRRSSGCVSAGAAPASAISAFAPSYDPLDGEHAHYTLDLSHTATAGTDAMDMAQRMGDGLVHLHLCDGSGASTDEHLVPGRGTQPTAEMCQMLAAGDFSGHVISR